MNNLPLIRGALLARAAELHIEGATEEATIDALLDREVRAAPPTEADCRAYYAQQRETLRPGAIAELDHILFAVTDPVPHPALRARAQATLDALRADDSSFAQLAQQLSNCPSAAFGGSLGQQTQADVVPEFWRAVAAQAADRELPCLLPQLVESRFGLHVVRVNRLAPGAVLPFDAARAQIEQQLAERNLRVALHDYVHRLVHGTGDADHNHPDHHPARRDHGAAAAATETRRPGVTAVQYASPRTTGCGGGGSCNCAEGS